MKTREIVLTDVLLAVLLLTSAAVPPAAGDGSPVFQIVRYGDPTPTESVRVVPTGAGFLVAPDGAALAEGIAVVALGKWGPWGRY